MDTQNVIYLHDGILFSHKKEQSTDIFYFVDETLKYAKWKKPDTNGHMLYDSIYVWCPEGQIHKDRK